MKETIINPIKHISLILEYNGYGSDLQVEHIKYDTDMNHRYDYQIIRSNTHDGAILFIEQLIDETLLPIINKQTYFIKDNVDFNKLKDIRYTVGDLIVKTDFNDSKYPTRQTDTTYLPVKCEYIY